MRRPWKSLNYHSHRRFLSFFQCSGGRGLKLEVWNNSRPAHLEEILEYNEKTPGYLGVRWIDLASHVWPMEQDAFVARISGFLVPPDSDFYRFYIKGDDRYALYFSQTGLPEDKVRTPQTLTGITE